MICDQFSVTFYAISKKTVHASEISLILFAIIVFPVSHAQSQAYFRDDFNYASIADLQNARWQILAQCTPYTPNADWSYVSVGNGLVTIMNDGSRGTALCHDLSGSTDWSAETRAEWVGGNYGTMNLYVFLSGISYGYKFWIDDYFGLYEFDKYVGAGGTSIWIQSRPHLQPHTSYTMKIQRQSSTLSLYLDGTQVYTYQETDPSFLSRSLARVGIEPGWVSTISFDYVEVGSPTVVSTITSEGASSVGSVTITSFTTGTVSTNGVSTIYTLPQSLVENLQNSQWTTQLSIFASIVGTFAAIIGMIAALPFYSKHLRRKKKKHRGKRKKEPKR